MLGFFEAHGYFLSKELNGEPAPDGKLFIDLDHAASRGIEGDRSTRLLVLEVGPNDLER